MERSARETLDSLSVTTLRSVRQTVAGLSGGQRQSVAVAKAVMWNSNLVILDEPTAALGVAQTRQVLNLVRRLGRARSGRGLRLPQPPRRLRVRRSDHRPAPRPTRRAVRAVADDSAGGRARDHRGTLGTSREWRRPRWSSRDDERRPDRRRSSLNRRPSRRRTLSGYIQVWWQGVRGGELGSLPIILGLAVIFVVFGILEETSSPSGTSRTCSCRWPPWRRSPSASSSSS